MYLSCLEPASECCSNNNSDKESATFTSDKTGGCFTDGATAASGIEPADAASFGDGVVQDTQFGKERGIVHGRLAREPVDRARYIVINGSSGTMFACSRCGKQYIHRKSLNKHWNDKHADDTVDRGKYLLESLHNAALVQCPSDSKHVALSCSSSLIRSAVHSHTVCSPTFSIVAATASRQKTDDNLPRKKTKYSSTIGQSVLWHSLAAIHWNKEPDLNSFCYAPMPAHTGGYNSGRTSFLNEISCDDDCQVLDLSVGSSAVYELSHIAEPDVPVDLSVKSKNVCLTDSEKVALPLHGVVKTASKSAVNCCKEMLASDALVLNKSERVGGQVATLCGSRKDRKSVQSDSIAVLRHLRSSISASAMKQSNNSSSAVAAVSIESKSDCTKLEPTGKYLQLPNSVHKKIVKIPAEISDDLATPEQTHEYFGGMSRGGHIRCKKCDFCATSMLLFSQHVAWHVRKPNVLSGICDSVQNECGDSIHEMKGRFFMWLGLQHTDDADVDNEKKSSGRCCNAAGDSLDTNEKLEDSTYKDIAADISHFAMKEMQANGFGSHCDEESGPQRKNFNSDLVQQKRGGGYRRGLGLTTTESRDAAGRSWRRRRLRMCDRCGYITDNVTTLKRHKVKHGAAGMYRCKLCDYTVNQQHILEYHTRNVHGPSRQTGLAQLTLFRITDTPLIDNIFDKRFGKDATSLIGDGHEAALSESLSETVNTGDSAVKRGCGVFTCNSDVVKVHGIHSVVSSGSVQKVMGKNVFASVTLARRHLLDAFGLRVGRGVCVRCGFRSLSAMQMKRHMLRHPCDQHACSQCLHTSPTARLLLKHSRQQHVDSTTRLLAQKVYQCLECPFVAASASQLQCHSCFHDAKLRHICDKCSYSADRANLIAEHRHLHVSAAMTAMKKRCWLHCSNCPFRTTNKGSLANHERGHSAVNCRYVCSLCSFGTNVANVAFGHQQVHSCVK